MKPEKPPVPKGLLPDGTGARVSEEGEIVVLPDGAQVEIRSRDESEVADKLRQLADDLEAKKVRVAALFFILDGESPPRPPGLPESAVAVPQAQVSILVDDQKIPDIGLSIGVSNALGDIAKGIEASFRKLGWDPYDPRNESPDEVVH